MSSSQQCPECGATSPVFMKNHCGGCPAYTGIMKELGTLANPSTFGKPAFGLEPFATAEAASGAGERAMGPYGATACPWCRSIKLDVGTNDETNTESVKCMSCGAHGPAHDDSDRSIRLWNALSSIPPATDPAIPDGWKLVPMEPTQQQHNAGNMAQDDIDQTDARVIYRAMLAAAPTIPATGEFRLTFGDWYEAKQGDAVPIGWYQWRDSEGKEYGPFHNEGKLNHPGAEDPVFTAGVTGCRQGFKVATIPATGHAATEGEG